MVDMLQHWFLLGEIGDDRLPALRNLPELLQQDLVLFLSDDVPLLNFESLGGFLGLLEDTRYLLGFHLHGFELLVAQSHDLIQLLVVTG